MSIVNLPGLNSMPEAGWIGSVVGSAILALFSIGGAIGALKGGHVVGGIILIILAVLFAAVTAFFGVGLDQFLHKGVATSVPTSNPTYTGTPNPLIAGTANPMGGTINPSYTPTVIPLSSLSSAGANILNDNGTLSSPDGQYSVVMQHDGNLVMYRTTDRAPVWASHTAGQGTAPFQLNLAQNGNMCVYDTNNSVEWCSGSQDKGTAPWVASVGSGSFCINDSTGTNTWCAQVATPQLVTKNPVVAWFENVFGIHS